MPVPMQIQLLTHTVAQIYSRKDWEEAVAVVNKRVSSIVTHMSNLFSCVSHPETTLQGCFGIRTRKLFHFI